MPDTSAFDFFHLRLMRETLQYVVDRPYSASFKSQLKPDIFYSDTSIKDVTFKLAAEYCLVGDDAFIPELIRLIDAIEEAKAKAKAKAEDEIHGKKALDIFFNTLMEEFARLAEQKNLSDHDVAELKKMKKNIHSLMRLSGYDFYDAKNVRIVNLEKLLKRVQDNSTSQDAADRIALNSFLENATETDNKKLKLKQKYAVGRGIEAITPEKTRDKRKKQKWRINGLSLAISIIVGIGEGLIAAVFAAASWPFVLSLLVVGIPAAICNFVLFRADSFDVMKQIWFGKAEDTPLQRKLKTVSTLFSAGAGVAYGFLSFGSAMTAFGHLFFGLTTAAAMTAPPLGLIFLAAVIAVVTAVALTTLYDFMIRRFIDKADIGKLKKIKQDFVDYFKPKLEKGETLGPKFVLKKIVQVLFHVTFAAIGLAVSVVAIIATTRLFKHKAVDVFHGAFRLSDRAAQIVSDVVVYGLGAAINALFYGKSAFFLVNTIKSVVHAIAHPKETAQKIRETWNHVKHSAHKKIEFVATGFRRLILFGSIAMNSGVGQGMGMGGSSVVDNAVAVVTGLSPANAGTMTAVDVTTASGGANLNAAVNLTGTHAFFGHPHRDDDQSTMETLSPTSPLSQKRPEAPAKLQHIGGGRFFDVSKPVARQTTEAKNKPSTLRRVR